MPRARSLLAAVSIAFAVVPLAATSAPAHPTGQAWESTYLHRHPYLVCLRQRETPGHRVPHWEDGYTYATGNGYYGAYQYLPRTWASASRYAGYPYLSYTLPNRISMEYQDRVTLKYARATRGSPWGYACSGYLSAWPGVG